MKMCSGEVLDSPAAERDPGAQDTQVVLVVAPRGESSNVCLLVLNRMEGW